MATETSSGSTPPVAAARYLDLLKLCLTRIEFGENHYAAEPRTWVRKAAYALFKAATKHSNLRLVREVPVDRERRRKGLDWPPPVDAETMIGLERLNNIQDCIWTVVRDDIKGDLIETGVWRGGATIFMRACLDAFGDETRKVFAADSFEGLPKPDATRYPTDAGDTHWTYTQLAVGLETVRRNFDRYGLLDDRTEFLVGWFKDTLPAYDFNALALLRLDGDMYESTIDALRPLYPKLSPGGIVIVDDFHVVPGCRAAVTDYRAEMQITEPIEEIDGSGVFWRKKL